MTALRILAVLLITAAVSLVVGAANAATIVVSYEHGHPEVLINGYRTQAMGTFRLADGDEQHLALCIEAHEPHSTRQDAYAPAGNRVDSAHLDTLLWLLERQPAVDDDLAVAAASLAWYYAQAHRSIGPLVWSNGNDGFAPIGPLAPEPWDALPRFTLDHMVGLRTGHTELDRVEVAVAVLHRRVEAMRGPWALAEVDHRFRLTGPAGPIAGQPIDVTVRVGDASPVTTTLTTDAAGWVAPEVGEPDDGATISASADSPGAHREWDGDGAIQRMATATNRQITAGFDVAPLPRHVHVQKISTDPTIVAAGGEFELIDATGAVVGTARSDAAGIARFEPIDPVAHPGPWTVRETVAPPGLDRTALNVTLPQLSTDAGSPTVVEMTNEPTTVPLRVRKALSEPDVGPADRSGFVFSIVRRGDDWADELVTDEDGRTDPALVALGTYDVCERSMPHWATTLIDGGCIEVVVDLQALADEAGIEITYVNAVPPALIDTKVRDVADGDQSLPSGGGPIADRVDLSGLVPGTTYELRGRAIEMATGNELAVVVNSFTAESESMVVDLAFDLPPMEPGAVVITEELRVGDRVVATHHDLTDLDQTLTIVAPPTTTSSTTTSTTTTTAPTTTVPTPTTTVPPTTTTSSTTPSTTTTTSTTAVATTTTTTTVPAPPPIDPPTPPTLPATGSDAAAALLRAADIGFVLGVALIAFVSYAPRREERLRDAA